jgi:hypothetical protein
VRLRIRVFGITVLDITTDADDDAAEEAPADPETAFQFADSVPLVIDSGRPADALVGFYQPPYYPEEDHHARATRHPRVR